MEGPLYSLPLCLAVQHLYRKYKFITGSGENGKNAGEMNIDIVPEGS